MFTGVQLVMVAAIRAEKERGVRDGHDGLLRGEILRAC